MKMPNDPVSIEKIKQCEDETTCIYKSYKADEIRSKDAKCIANTELSNTS